MESVTKWRGKEVTWNHILPNGEVIDIPHAWRYQKLKESHELRKLSHEDLAKIYIRDLQAMSMKDYKKYRRGDFEFHGIDMYGYYRDLFVQTGNGIYLERMLEKVTVDD